MICPPSTELRASRSGCHDNTPLALPFSMSNIIALNLFRPGAFADFLSITVSTIYKLLSAAYLQFDYLRLDTQYLLVLYIGAFAHIDDVFFLALLLHTCPLNLNSRSAGHNLEEPNCTERLYKPTKYNSSLFDCVHSYFTALRAKTKHARLPFVKPPVAAKIQKGAAYGCPRNFSPMIF